MEGLVMPGALTYLLFLPAIAALPIAFERDAKLARILALVVTGVEFFVSVALFVVLKSNFSLHERWLLYTDRPWIPQFGIHYSLGLDGISLLLVMLTALLFFISVAASWKGVTERVPLFHVMLLVMETGVMGVFLAADLFLFYLFWEVMLIPMFLIIGIWGHGRRIYSALKFFIFTVTGSLLMLLSIIGLYIIHGQQTGVYSFLSADLLNTQVPLNLQMWLFAGFLLGFAVKVPMFPIHTWLPDAHTDAPTAGSIILAGLLLKTGTYGMLRFAFPLLPLGAAAFLPLIYALCMIGIFYAAWVAYAQEDMKRLVAYSSISHLAYVVLGIAVWNEVALAGSVLQMVNHGISTGALFVMVGMFDERMHTREIGYYGGLWSKAPVLSAFFLLFILSSLGLPGLNNFTGEFLILVGLFRSHPVMSVAAFGGLVFALTYLLRLAQKVLFGPVNPAVEAKGFHDATPREVAVLVPLALLVIIIGLYPSFLLAPLKVPARQLMIVNYTMSGPEKIMPAPEPLGAEK
jgi:NADH-quinone oxidoreductase subunit M